MNTDSAFISGANAIAPFLREARRRLHRFPELGRAERETPVFLAKQLRDLGLEVYPCADTGLVGILRGGRPGPVAALRADMDALPISEESGCSYPSEKPGLMHACGHDFHMTAALGAARLLAQRRENLPGTVKFFFQPDEEGSGGAQRMIDGGCLDNPRVEAVFGAHVSPDLPAGSVGFRYGKFYAASDLFDLAFLGKSAHGAEPEKGVDALSPAAAFVHFLPALRRELEEKHGKVILSVGSFHSGSVRNIIAARAELQGIIRTLGPEARSDALEGLQSLVRRVASDSGTETELSLTEGYPGIVNHDGMCTLAENTAKNLFGRERVFRIESPTMTTEDFGCFLEKAPGCFYHFGVGGTYPLHSSRFFPPEELLPDAAAFHAAVITAFLERPTP